MRYLGELPTHTRCSITGDYPHGDRTGCRTVWFAGTQGHKGGPKDKTERRNLIQVIGYKRPCSGLQMIVSDKRAHGRVLNRKRIRVLPLEFDSRSRIKKVN